MQAGQDIAGLISLPLAVASQSSTSDPGRLVFNYQLKVNGQYSRICGAVTSSCELPLHTDSLVLLGLVQLWLAEPEPSEALWFERRDLLDLLGWECGGYWYERLAVALGRLGAVTIVLETPLTTRSGLVYENLNGGARLIEQYRTTGSHPARCLVKWGNFVLEARRLQDFKRLDWNVVRQVHNAFTVSLYRLLDRMALDGSTTWSVGWRTLAAALGVKASAYARAGRFHQMLRPHLEALLEAGVLIAADYERGGTFSFELANYRRASLRQALTALGLDADQAGHLVAGHDELSVAMQCDCLINGSPKFQQAHPLAYLITAIEQHYPVCYPSASVDSFRAAWATVPSPRQQLYRRAVEAWFGATDPPSDCTADPITWSQETRAVVRFMVDHNVDPARICDPRLDEGVPQHATEDSR